jgi:molybdopterin converting factor subunit 1
MRVRVKLFAIVKDKLGTGQLDIDLPSDATVQSALEQLSTQHPSLQALLPKLATAVNGKYVRGEHVLAEADELSLIPPVSGG